jgi:hypothetical protein
MSLDRVAQPGAHKSNWTARVHGRERAKVFESRESTTLERVALR